MQYMVIKLDEERIKEEGEYSPEKLWEAIDYAFRDGHIIKKPQADGSVEYWGNPKYENYLGYFGAAFRELKHNKRFVQYAVTWIWYDNDDDESLPYDAEDCLSIVKKDAGLL